MDIEKEDGQNEFVICQLKSTDAQSIKVNQKDIRILEKNARVAHKIPVFAIQFLNTNEVWLLVKPESLTPVSEYLTSGKVSDMDAMYGIDIVADDLKPKKKVDVKSAEDSRKNFFAEREKEYKNKKRR